MSKNEYNPTFISPPGETLREALKEREITQADLEKTLNLDFHTVEGLLQGVIPLTEEISAGLESATGIPASFWKSSEKRYRENLRKNKETLRESVAEFCFELRKEHFKFALRSVYRTELKNYELTSDGYDSVWRNHYYNILPDEDCDYLRNLLKVSYKTLSEKEKEAVRKESDRLLENLKSYAEEGFTDSLFLLLKSLEHTRTENENLEKKDS